MAVLNALRIWSSVTATVAAIVLAFAPAKLVAAPADMIEPAALAADLRLAIETIEQRHPDLAHSTSRAKLKQAADRLRRKISRPVDQAGAWALLAQLNPVLADGHLFLGLPDWRGRSKAAIAAGAGHFPFEVIIDRSGYPVIAAHLGGSVTPLAGRRILRINGADSRAVTRAALARAHGDSQAFRAELVADRWWLFYAQLYGRPATFDLAIAGDQRPTTIAASRIVPAVLQREASFERQFDCAIVDGVATLRLGTFDWEDKPRFLAFTHDCFTRIKASSTQRLMIDISANGGGNDDLWKDGVLRYIASRPYKHGSTYRKRERNGEVTVGAIATAVAPVANEPLMFTGELAVKISPKSYSSAVLFANVVRDYGFGVLVGTGGAVRTRQSGGVQGITLPNSGIVLNFPRFVIDPPKHPGAPAWLL